MSINITTQTIPNHGMKIMVVSTAKNYPNAKILGNSNPFSKKGMTSMSYLQIKNTGFLGYFRWHNACIG